MIINKIVYGPDGLISFNKCLISRGQSVFNKRFNKWPWGDWVHNPLGEWMEEWWGRGMATPHLPRSACHIYSMMRYPKH